MEDLLRGSITWAPLHGPHRLLSQVNVSHQDLLLWVIAYQEYLEATVSFCTLTSQRPRVATVLKRPCLSSDCWRERWPGHLTND